MSTPKEVSKRSRFSSEPEEERLPLPKRTKVSFKRRNKHQGTPDPEAVSEDDEETRSSLTSPGGKQRSDDDDEGDADADLETTLAITAHRGTIGAAFFDPVQRVLQLLEDTHESGHFDFTRLAFEQLRPDIVLVGSRADEALIHYCQVYADEMSARVQVRPHKEFSPEQGREKMLCLRIVNEIESYTSSDHHDQTVPLNAYNFMRGRNSCAGDPHLKRWIASIRTSNFGNIAAPFCMSSVGALLDHLARINATDDLIPDKGLDIVDIQALSLESCMLINADALHSLQVFFPESHASIHSDKTKEGLSLFGIMDHTRTKSGRALLKRWLLRPSLDVQIIRSRHDAVECFLLADNLPAVDAIQGHLRGLKTTPRTMGSLKLGRARIAEWTALVKFTYHVMMLREAIGELSCASGVVIVERVEDVLHRDDFQVLGTIINETIDWEASSNEARLCVRHNVDPQLDEKKRIYDSLSIFLSRIAKQIGENVPPDIGNELNVIYFPQLGYLIAIPLREDWKDTASVNVVPGWTFQFATEEHTYFKNSAMHDLDHHLGDIKSVIADRCVARHVRVLVTSDSLKDREIEIIHGLQERVLESETLIRETCDICAELDCLLALATASRLYSWTRPEVTERNVLEVHNGRHPLQELCEASFVPNSLSLTGNKAIKVDDGGQTQAADDRESSVLICTGPNACGKSIYLKQNALMPIMSQVGCFVPAEHATLGIVDKVFTRIQTRESVGKIQSAFMIDLAQVSMAVRNCTARSLVVLDEFGKGTTPSDGGGLLCGVLKHLLSRDADCPMVLVATHYHQLFRGNLLPTSFPIQFCHMEVIVSEEVMHLISASDDIRMRPDIDGDCDEELDIEVKRRLLDHFTFLFRVAPGFYLNSHGTQCALLNGVPRRIVRRAKRVSDCLVKQDMTSLLDDQMTEKEVEELQEVEAVARRFCSLNLDAATDLRLRLKEVLGRSLQIT